MQELNQFKQTSVRGQLALRGEGTHIISCLVAGNDVLEAGDMVKLVAGATLPTVEKATAGDTGLGFVLYNVIRNEHKAGEMVEIAITGEVLKMVAGGAIVAGSKVDYTVADGKMAVAGGNGVGVALTSAVADGDLFDVYIKTI